MKKNTLKAVIISSVILVIIIFLVLIYINLFAGTSDSRNKNMDKYKITNDEKNAVQSKLKEVTEIESIDIHTNNNSRIVKILVTLNKDVEFAKMKNLAQESLKGFSEKSLGYYDFEFFIDTKEASEIYPKIGYKYVNNEDFSW